MLKNKESITDHKGLLMEIIDSFNQNLPDGKQYAGILKPLFFPLSSYALLKGRWIVFDDLERVSKSFSMESFMGLVEYLVNQLDCRIMLVLNNKKLFLEQNESWNRYFEKLIDKEIELKMDAKEAFETSFSNHSLVLEQFKSELLDVFVRCNISNIRLMKKILSEYEILVQNTDDSLRPFLKEPLPAIVLWLLIKFNAFEEIDWSFLDLLESGNVNLWRDCDSPDLNKKRCFYFDLYVTKLGIHRLQVDQVFKEYAETGLVQDDRLRISLEVLKRISLNNGFRIQINDFISRCYDCPGFSNSELKTELDTLIVEWTADKFVPVGVIESLCRAVDDALNEAERVQKIEDLWICSLEHQCAHENSNVLQDINLDSVVRERIKKGIRDLQDKYQNGLSLKDVLLRVISNNLAMLDTERQVIKTATEDDFKDLLSDLDDRIWKDVVELLIDLRSYRGLQDSFSAFIAASKDLEKTLLDDRLRFCLVKKLTMRLGYAWRSLGSASSPEAQDNL